MKRSVYFGYVCYKVVNLKFYVFAMDPNLFSPRSTKLNSGGLEATVLKEKQKKTQLNSQGSNPNLLMRHLMLFAITNISHIRVRWRSWSKEGIRQVMIWYLQMQCTHYILHCGEQLFTIVQSAKQAHYLLDVGNKVGELSGWKNMVLIETKDVSSKELGLQIFWTLKISEFHLQF